MVLGNIKILFLMINIHKKKEITELNNLQINMLKNIIRLVRMEYRQVQETLDVQHIKNQIEKNLHRKQLNQEEYHKIVLLLLREKHLDGNNNMRIIIKIHQFSIIIVDKLTKLMVIFLNLVNLIIFFNLLNK
jgi:hypothetical protein